MKNRLFNENSNYDEIKSIILKNVGNAFNVANLKLISRGISAFNRLKNDERIVSYSKDVDKLYSDNTTNEFNKIPIILSGSIILDGYKENADKMTNEELSLLSYYSLIGDIDFYNVLFTPDIIKEVCKKTSDLQQRYNFLEVVEDSYDMFYDEMNEENVSYIRNGLERFSKRLSGEDFTFLFEALNQRIIDTVNEKGIAL